MRPAKRGSLARAPFARALLPPTCAAAAWQEEEMAVWSHPIDVHYTLKGIDGWPRLKLEVWGDSTSQCDVQARRRPRLHLRAHGMIWPYRIAPKTWPVLKNNL